MALTELLNDVVCRYCTRTLDEVQIDGSKAVTLVQGLLSTKFVSVPESKSPDKHTFW